MERPVDEWIDGSWMNLWMEGRVGGSVGVVMTVVDMSGKVGR